MADRHFAGTTRHLEREIVKLYGVLTFGASGAISAFSTPGMAVTVVGAKDGRYLVTLEDSYPAFKALLATIEGATDAALTAADGNLAVLRNVDSAAGTFEIQLVRTDTLADADPTSGNKLFFEVTLKNTTVAI